MTYVRGQVPAALQKLLALLSDLALGAEEEATDRLSSESQSLGAGAELCARRRTLEPELFSTSAELFGKRPPKQQNSKTAKQ